MRATSTGAHRDTSVIRLATTSRAVTASAVEERPGALSTRWDSLRHGGGRRGSGARTAAARKPHPHHQLRTQSQDRTNLSIAKYREPIPRVADLQPDFQAVRQVALARKLGFEAIRAANRESWSQLWKGRITLVGADRRWQALADAVFFTCSAQPMLRHRRRPRSSVWRPGTTTIMTMAT